MKNFKNKFLYLLLGSSLALTSCEKLLDRPPLDDIVDSPGLYWNNESDVRLFTSGFYTQYFNGYNTSYTTDYTPVRGYALSDDITFYGQQSSFEVNVPPSREQLTESGAWLANYGGPSWNFSWVRKSNIFLNRLETIAKPNLTEEQYNHWMAVARFFKGFEYSRLVSVFGDVPYYENEVPESDFAVQYKDRDDRGVVMDKVYDDFVFVLNNIRVNDGANTLDRKIAASFISRIMLFEGSWQTYHNLDKERAKKYLELSKQAAELVMSSGKYDFTSDFKSLFASQDLATNKEVIMYRAYSSEVNIFHAIASYQNGIESQATSPNLNLLKEFIMVDGKPSASVVGAAADTYSLKNLAITRDSRLEASFDTDLNIRASSLVYGNKYVSRNAYKITASNPDYSKWSSNTNTSYAPVMRYAEVVLNWIEAKQILAENYGGAAVTQADLDNSINAIRKRPLDAVAIAKGVKKTAPLLLASIVADPSRDPDVSPLMWEIRRERRMEFVFEFSRLHDLRRWKKLDYMNYAAGSDYFLGPWVNLQQDAPTILTTASNINLTRVVNKDGSVIVFDGNNADKMEGFYVIPNATPRVLVQEKNYLAPVGQAQIADYESRGYKLTQTKGW